MTVVLALSLLASLALFLTLLGHLSVRMLLRRACEPPAHWPPVSILKPLKGIDDGLEENLASFAALDYGDFQIVLGIADAGDPAVAVARRFRARHPEMDVRVVVGAPPLGRNPKVTNLAALSRQATHELLLISDSNVRVQPSYLRDTVAAYHQPGVGLVTNLFAGVGERSLGGLLENLQLATWVAGSVAAAQVVTGRACVVGKSMLFSRSLLDAHGGWPALADVLAEDYAFGAWVARQGLRTVTAPHVIHTVNASWSLQRFANRHLRWAQIRRRMSLPAWLGEPLTHPTPWLLAAAVAGAPAFAVAGLIVKVLSDASLAHRLRGVGFSLPALLLIPLKDLLITTLWLIGGFRRRIWWRGNVLWIGAGTRLLEPPRPHTAATDAEPISAQPRGLHA